MTVAQKVQILFTDDIDGSEAEGTTRFALDGAEYEIDLNAGNREALHAGLAKFIDAARPVKSGSRKAASRRQRAPGQGPSPIEVREWAKSQGIKVSDRGRVPVEVTEQFKAAHA
jgi:Lsr2